jgi:hypothetical protein
MTVPAPPPDAGLCGTCVHARLIASARAPGDGSPRAGRSIFVLCERSFADPAFPRYPGLPVLACRGYEETNR